MTPDVPPTPPVLVPGHRFMGLRLPVPLLPGLPLLGRLPPGLLILALALPGPAHAQRPPLTVRLAHDSEAERALRNQLLRLVGEHDLSAWIVTTEVLVDETEIPHSHPVLTVHTRHLGDDDALLSTFLHEQFHWWVNERREALDRAKAAMRELFPEVPHSAEGGARDDESTYLHLVVCDLELQATTALLGEERAREVQRAWTHYEWIYRQVLGDPRIREVLEREGLTVG